MNSCSRFKRFGNAVRLLLIGTCLSVAATAQVRINAGGAVSGTFGADAFYQGGTAAKTATAINTAAATNPAPQAVYQTERWGACTYTIKGLTAGTSYTARLHFAEIYFTAAAKRQFNVSINGTQVLNNFDIFTAAGGANKAVVKEFSATATGGQIVIALTAGAANNPKIAGIEILGGSIEPPATSINSGGDASGAFAKDANFQGGTAAVSNVAINTSAVVNPAPQAVYQSERWGAFTYTFGGLEAGSAYIARLHFAEFYFKTAGQRQFNVSINGTQVLKNFDIVAEAGAANKAIVKEFPATVSSNGQVVIAFSVGAVNNAKISGIELTPDNVVILPPTPPSGLVATASGSNLVNLTWSASATAKVTYNVYRSTNSGFAPAAGNQIASAIKATNFSDTAVAPSMTYFYLATAVNSLGESDPTNQAQATTPVLRVTGLNATAVGAKKVSLAWNPLNNVAAYAVFRSTTKGFTPGLENRIATPVSPSFDDASVEPNTDYYYRVAATVGQIDTPPSDELNVKTPIEITTGNISKWLLGQNDWYGLPDSIWPIVKESRVECVRIGGIQYDSNPFDNNTLLHHVDMIRSAGAEPLIQVSRHAAPSRAADMVNFINNVSKRNVRLWSIGNEPDLGNGASEASIANTVANYTKARSSAMRDADPSILIFAGEMAWYSTGKYYPMIGGADDITGKDSKGRWIVDGFTFHRYPFGANISRDAALNEMHNGFSGTVNNLKARMDMANAMHGRTGADALQWGTTEWNMTYANPGNNGPADNGVSSFLNGQLFAEFFKVGMARQATMLTTWSIAEGGGNGSKGDLGYLGGSTANPIRRASYYHTQMIGNYLLPGNVGNTYLNSNSNLGNVTSIATATSIGTIAVMILNEDTGTHTLAVRLQDNTVQADAQAKIKVFAEVPAEYTDSIPGQSTMVLVFDAQGTLKKKVTYSLGDYSANRAPSVQNF